MHRENMFFWKISVLGAVANEMTLRRHWRRPTGLLLRSAGQPVSHLASCRLPPQTDVPLSRVSQVLESFGLSSLRYPFLDESGALLPISPPIKSSPYLTPKPSHPSFPSPPSCLEAPFAMADKKNRINLNEEPEEALALSIVLSKELVPMPPKELVPTPPKLPYDHAYYAQAIPRPAIAPSPPSAMTLGVLVRSVGSEATTLGVLVRSAGSKANHHAQEAQHSALRVGKKLMSIATNKQEDPTCIKYQSIKPRLTILMEFDLTRADQGCST